MATLSPEVLKKMSVLKINRERDLYKKVVALLTKKNEKEAYEYITQFCLKWCKVGEFVNYWVTYIIQETIYREMFGLAEKLLKFDGIDPNVKDAPIHVASMYNRIAWINLLLDLPGAKLDLNIQDMNGKTALHWAMLKGYREIIQRLVDAGCDESVKDDNGKDCVQVAMDSDTRTFALGLITEREEKRKKLEERRKRKEMIKRKEEERKKREAEMAKKLEENEGGD